MKRKLFAICDLEESYARKLMDYLNEKKSTPFEVQAFTNTESLLACARRQEISLLLISSHAVTDEIRELPIGRLIILSDGDPFPDLEEYPSVYKYQSSDHLVAEVMEYYAAEHLHLQSFPVSRKKTHLYGVYSPVHRCGKTSFAVTLGEVLAEEHTVLYINLEPFSGFEELFGRKGEKDLSDLLYYFRQKEEMTIFHLNAMIRTLQELSFIPPALDGLDLQDVTEEEWLSLLGHIIENSEYEYFILDLGDHIHGFPEILSLCEKVYMPVLEDSFSQAKVHQFENMLERYHLKDLSGKLQKLSLPQKQAKSEYQDIQSQLLWGEMGNYVRNLLWEKE